MKWKEGRWWKEGEVKRGGSREEGSEEPEKVRVRRREAKRGYRDMSAIPVWNVINAKKHRSHTRSST